MDIKDVEKIAVLARLELDEKEKEKYTGQLVKILDYIGLLKELDTADVEPVEQPLVDRLRLAEDKISEFKDYNKISEIAPDFKAGFFRVKKIIE